MNDSLIARMIRGMVGVVGDHDHVTLMQVDADIRVSCWKPKHWESHNDVEFIVREIGVRTGEHRVRDFLLAGVEVGDLEPNTLTWVAVDLGTMR